MEDENTLVGRAEKLGLQLRFESGFVIVRRPAMPDEATGALAETVIRGLAAQLTAVGRVLLARCRNTRGQQFLGRLAFGVDYDIVGTIAACSGDRVDLRYRADAGEERERQSVGPAHADNVLIIADAPDPADASSGFPVSVDERFQEFIERADRLGVKFWWNSGFVLASFGRDRKAVAEMLRTLDSRPKKSGLDSYIATVSPWVTRMVEIRRLVLARARAVRGGDFIGADVFAPPIGSIDGYDAKGTIKSFGDGGFIISARNAWAGETALACGCEHCLIVIDDEREPTEVPSSSAAPGSEAASGSWLRRAFTGN